MRAVVPGVRSRPTPLSSLIEKRLLDGEGHYIAPGDHPEQFRKSLALERRLPRLNLYPGEGEFRWKP